jgi:hypothetical protein
MVTSKDAQALTDMREARNVVVLPDAFCSVDWLLLPGVHGHSHELVPYKEKRMY